MELRISVLFESAILIFFASSPWKLVNIYRLARMGRNFDDYPGFQPKEPFYTIMHTTVSRAWKNQDLTSKSFYPNYRILKHFWNSWSPSHLNDYVPICNLIDLISPFSILYDLSLGGRYYSNVRNCSEKCYFVRCKSYWHAWICWRWQNVLCGSTIPICIYSKYFF